MSAEERVAMWAAIDADPRVRVSSFLDAEQPGDSDD